MRVRRTIHWVLITVAVAVALVGALSFEREWAWRIAWQTPSPEPGANPNDYILFVPDSVVRISRGSARFSWHSSHLGPAPAPGWNEYHEDPDWIPYGRGGTRPAAAARKREFHAGPLHWYLRDQARQILSSPTRSFLWSRYVFLEVQVWVLSGLLVAWPLSALAFGAVRKRRRRKQGRCLACGYDLTGNVSGLCPECGAKICEEHDGP